MFVIPVSLSVTPSARHLSQRARLTHDSNFLAKTKKFQVDQSSQSSNKTTKSSQTKKVPSKSNTSIKQQKPQIIANKKSSKQIKHINQATKPPNHRKPKKFQVNQNLQLCNKSSKLSQTKKLRQRNLGV